MYIYIPSYNPLCVQRYRHVPPKSFGEEMTPKTISYFSSYLAHISLPKNAVFRTYFLTYSCCQSICLSYATPVYRRVFSPILRDSSVFIRLACLFEYLAVFPTPNTPTRTVISI